MGELLMNALNDLEVRGFSVLTSHSSEFGPQKLKNQSQTVRWTELDRSMWLCGWKSAP